MFVLDENQQLQGVNYSPQFEGPLEASPDQMSLFYQAYKTFVKVKRLERIMKTIETITNPHD